MNLIFSILVRGFVVLIAGYILPGVTIENFFVAIVVAVVLGLVNTFIKPLLVLLTLPVTILTLGLFMFVINALLVLLVSRIVPGFHVLGFWWALLFSLVVSLISALFQRTVRE
jgi:putative membrane protein